MGHFHERLHGLVKSLAVLFLGFPLLSLLVYQFVNKFFLCLRGIMNLLNNPVRLRRERSMKLRGNVEGVF